MDRKVNTTLPISVIIPTYSEEIMLPKLLESLENQVIGPSEIIVSDAFSPDRTREIAKEHGCRIVDGGKIAVGRNNGANAAVNEILLFIDADTTLPTSSTLIEVFAEFLKSESDIASVGYKPEKNGSTVFGMATSTVMFSSLNAIRKIQNITQKPVLEGGAFILVKKSVFEHVGGFSVTLGVGEDGDFFRRASKRGYKYNNLSQSVFTSTRRYDNPKKASKTLVALAAQTLLLVAGVYVGSAIFKRAFKGYGNLGGGKGKNPNDD